MKNLLKKLPLKTHLFSVPVIDQIKSFIGISCGHVDVHENLEMYRVRSNISTKHPLKLTYSTIYQHHETNFLFNVSQLFCPSVFSSVGAAWSLAVSTGQSSLVASLKTGGGMFRHST